MAIGAIFATLNQAVHQSVKPMQNATINPYHSPFPEAERPRFTLSQAMLMVLLIVLALMWWAESRSWSPFTLSARELAALREEQQEQERDLVFRFLNAPTIEEAPPEVDFYSDANREFLSRQDQELPPENDDPISRGDTYELEQRSANPVPLPRNPVTVPTDQPPLPEVTESEATETESAQEDPSIIPQFDGGPKPYRKPTQQEQELARKRAQKQMAIASTAPSRGPGYDRNQYENPMGRSAPKLGFSIDTAGHDLGPYLNKLKQLVRGHWRIPTIAQFEVSGFAVVEFKLHRDGRITDTVVRQSSRYEPLDVSAFNAIHTIHTAPPLPSHIDEEWIPIKFGFYFNMRPPY